MSPISYTKIHDFTHKRVSLALIQNLFYTFTVIVNLGITCLISEAQNPVMKRRINSDMCTYVKMLTNMKLKFKTIVILGHFFQGPMT